MFTENYNFAVVQTALDSVFLGEFDYGDKTYQERLRVDEEYERYNKLREAKYTEQDKSYALVNKLLVVVLTITVICAIMYPLFERALT